ncbi:MAG: sigma-70 family RNA polymerase sigma factor [Myxococcota bacterium]
MTDDNPLHQVVQRAQKGDLAAFDELVRASRTRATAVAWARLGSEERAEEAVQEAFIDAWRLLPTLREPRAFRAWLKSIVRKHADRRTRRARLETVPLDEGRAGLEPGEPDEVATVVRQAVAQLPPHQRNVVEPFYLHGMSTKAIAQSLGCSVAAVKKRLFDARRRLHPHLESWMTDTLPHVVRAFVAARTGDSAHLAQALTAHPELTEATDPPDEARVVEHYLPGHPTATLLLTAVIHGHTGIVDQVLASGADVNGGRPAGAQTPLMLAVLQSRGEMVERLLAAGADVHRVANRGFTALHFAALRADRALMDRLTVAGANVEARSANGWTAADWLAHAEAVPRPRPEGALRIVDPHGNALDGGPPLVTPERQPRAPGPIVETGIKPIDLWAPLANGRVTRVVGGPFVGKTVLLAEVMQRFAPPVLATFLDRSWSVKDFEHVLRECNVHPGARILIASDPSGAATLARSALAHAEARGSIVVADDRLIEELRAARPGVPVLAFSPNAHEVDPVLTADAQWVLSPELAKAGRWPAIDPRASRLAWSRPPEEKALVEAARALWAESGPRADRLHAYLTQPFWVGESYTGLPGVTVPWTATRADVARIVSGAVDDRPVDELRYRASL